MPTYCDVGKKVGQMRLHGREVGQVERLALRVDTVQADPDLCCALVYGLVGYY